MKKLIFKFLVCILFSTPSFANTIVVLGDSISAAYGIEQSDGWVSLLDRQLSSKYTSSTVINASISGDTTAGGLSRLPVVIEKHKPTVLIIELGGNDGLRGLPIKAMRRNLIDMVKLAKQAGIDVILCGVRLPPNYGPAYNRLFAKSFASVANQHEVALIQNILSDIDDNPDLLQKDGIHPTTAAQPMILDNVLPTLKALIEVTAKPHTLIEKATD